MGLPHPWKVLAGSEDDMPFDDSDMEKYGYLYDYDLGEGIRIAPPDSKPGGLYHRDGYRSDEPPRISAKDMRGFLEYAKDPAAASRADADYPFGNYKYEELLDRLNSYQSNRQMERDYLAPRGFY